MWITRREMLWKFIDTLILLILVKDTITYFIVISGFWPLPHGACYYPFCIILCTIPGEEEGTSQLRSFFNP